MGVSTSVVICAYTAHRWNQLLSAVRSVQAQETTPDELVLVIDHHDELLSRVRHALPSLHVVANEGPRGLSGARNTGIARSSGAVVAFLDDDAVAEPDWLSHLLVHYADPKVLGVGGSAQPEWETPAPRWWPGEFGWVIGCSYRGQPTSAAPVRNLMGCNMSIRRHVLEAVGGFESSLGRTADRPLGCEETELCIRARARFPDAEFIYEPLASVRHAVPRRRASWSYFRARCLAEGISKAQVARNVGQTAALSAETAYLRRVLPSGVRRNLDRGLHGDPSGFARAGAIVAGLGFTAVGFLGTRWMSTGRGLAARAEPTSSIHAARPLPQANSSTPPRGVSLPSTVVVATRDRPAALRECLQSILAGTMTPERLIVVDNAPSSQETAELVAGLARADPRLIYLREDRPGLARAHNAALPLVHTPVVAFTDDDVVVDRRWLEQLVSAIGDDDAVGCVTGLIAARELETLPQQWVEGNATFNKGLQRRVFDNRELRPPDPLFPYAAGMFGSGANMAFRSACLRELGGFDDALGAGTPAMGGDDLAAFFDVITSGRRLVYEPAAMVFHRHHRHYAGLRRQTHGYGAGLGAYLTRCFLREPSMALVFLRHAPALGRRATRVLQPRPSGLPRYPTDLTVQQGLGLLSGPWRYAVSRRRTQRERAG
jgi:GT2 family glycosyltransferase